MKRFSYGERDYSFGQTMLALRTSIGLTQTDLSEKLGISRRALGDWEAGNSYPKAHHLKAFLTLCVQASAFPHGREAEEIRALWQAAHQKMLLNEQWLSTLLQQPSPPPGPLPVAETSATKEGNIPPPASPTDQPRSPQSGRHQPSLELTSASAPAASEPQVDWGEALAVPSFYGRQQELATLDQWIVRDRCRVVSVLGLGGIGKSALVVHAMRAFAEHFKVVIFRSLRDTPSCETLLESCLQVLCPEVLVREPQSLSAWLRLLLEAMRRQRVLLVLDNLESLLQAGEVRGQLRPDFEAYGRLLRHIAESVHPSCLLLTSREKPGVLRGLEGSQLPVRSLRLTGLEASACEQILDDHELSGSLQERARLIQIYEANPLALNIVAQTIIDLLGGEIAPFLKNDTAIFGGIAQLLSEQWNRLSPLEQTVLCWLAIMREPVTLHELLNVLVTKLSLTKLLEAVDGLRRRSLIERGQRAGSFTLQSVVQEYVTDHLVTTICQEIQQGRLHLLCEHSLSQAQAREYVRQTQERLLLTPLLDLLQSAYQGQAQVDGCFCDLLSTLRVQAEAAQGYAPANLVALLRLLRSHLRGLDLSQLAIRGAHLQGVEMQDASLAEALIQDSIFTEALDVPRSVAISSKGEYWAAGSMSGVVHIWRKGVQVLHLAWQAHNNTISTLSFSPDEHFLATGSWDGALKLWDVTSGALLWTGGWHTKGLNWTAFSPDGSLLASSGSDAVVRLWNPLSGANLQELLHPDRVLTLAWSPDGHLLATGDFVGIIRLWHIHQNAPAICLQTISGHPGHWITGLSFAPDGKTLASASQDQTIKLWNVESEKSACLLRTLSGHTDQVYQAFWSPDGQTLASCGIDQTIRLWDVAQGRTRSVLHEHSLTIYGLAFTSDGSRLLSSSEDGSLRVWDMASEQCVQVVQGYAVSFYDVDWSPDSTRLVSGSTDGLVITWNVNEGLPARILRAGHRKLVCGVAWSPDGQWIASGGWDRAIRIWNATSGACSQIFHDPNNPDTVFNGVAWSFDGRYLACGSDIGGVQVWDVAERHLLWGGRKQPIWIDDVAWSSNGTYVASTGDDGCVYLWNSSDGTLAQRWPGHQDVGRCIVWSPDGSKLASCGGVAEHGELFVWDLHNASRIQIFAHPDIVHTVAWSLTGDLLISGCSDGTLRWWEVASGNCVRTQQAHQGTLQSLRRSPDGRWLASCGDDGAIKIWNLHSGAHQRTLRHDRPYERLNITAIRGLTQAQKATLRTLGAIENNEGEK
jgi:WD40 repeat protein/transcriptional regulator with XRE-family HTH domain